MSAECVEYGDAIVCREEMKEVRRETDREPRWCFVERKVTRHEIVVKMPVGRSYYGPSPSVRCASCGTADADLFPGRVREWEG